MGSDRLYKEILHKLKMTEGKRVLIILPDERRLELLVQPNLLSSDLLDLVTSQVSLKEKEYFGLAYIDETGHYSWLHHDRRVLDHEFPKKNPLPSVQPTTKCAFVLYFLIKFYVESISLLRDSHTVEHFYLQLRSMIFKDQIEIDTESVYTLAAWALHASYGDFIDESTAKNHLKKLPVLPTSVLKEHPSLSYCEDRVIDVYRSLAGQSRGQVIVNYLSAVESLPNYGVHFYEVKDKRNIPWWLGISYKGIAQYDYADRKQPRRVFQWKQLENLYFRDRKFSIEVHDPKRVVHAVSSSSIYPENPELQDELSDAFAEESTQVSVSRRTFQPGTISVIVWFGQTQALTKNIWYMAICQHQFYLDRRNSKANQTKVRNLSDIALDLSKSSTSLSLSTGSSNSQSNLSHSGSTLSLNNKMGQTPDTEESEASRAARMEIVSALKARKQAMEEKLKSKLEELKKICIQEGELTGQLPVEFPLSPGEVPPTIRRRVGTGFTLPENLLNKAKSSNEESLAALELEYEIQRKITSAALKLANDSSTSKAVRRQRKMLYQQSLQQLKDIETKLRTLRQAEIYNSTQAQPQVPVVTNQWSKQKKKPRPGTQSSLDEEGGFVKADLDTSDTFLSDAGVNLSPAPSGNAPSPTLITTAPIRRDRSLSPCNGTGNSIVRSELPKSAPASPQKLRPNNLTYQQYSNTMHQHPPLRRENSGGYIPSSVFMRSSYRSKQYPTLSTSHSTPGYITKEMNWDVHNHNGSSRVPSTALCPPLVGVDPNAGGGLYNIPRQRASHDFPIHSMDDLEVVGLRRLTGADLERTTQSHVQSPPLDQTLNSSFDFEWDFGEDGGSVLRRVDHVSHNRFGSLDRRRQQSSVYSESSNGQTSAKVSEGSKSLDELDGSSPVPVDVIDGASIGPRFGGRGLRKISSSSSNHSSNYNDHNLTLLPNQTYPEYNDFVNTTCDVNTTRSRSCSLSKMETVFDVDNSVFTRHPNHSMSSIHMKKKEKDWYETSLDSPVMSRRARMLNDKPISHNSQSLKTQHSNNTNTVRAQPVRIAEVSDNGDFEFDTVVPFEAPKNLEIISPGKWEPYREVSKPFETSDIYKYSTKYRQQQTKGVYQPLQPMACQPLNTNRISDLQTKESKLNTAQPSEFRSKPATLV